MILVADAGSTKIDWALIRPNLPPEIFTTTGLNPLLASRSQLHDSLKKALSDIPANSVSHIYYYGAGCTPQIIPMIEKALSEITRCPAVNVGSDMLGAARALCQNQPGIACILGTGSNTALYDGREIVDSIPSLGFILGDEGSGASIGRRFVADILKRRFPADITSHFFALTNLSQADIIERTYRQPQPNRFLASIAPYVRSMIDRPEVEALVIDEMSRFTTRNLLPYSATHTPLNFTGSIAFHFRKQLEKALSFHGLRIGVMVSRPIEKLIEYHNRKPLQTS